MKIGPVVLEKKIFKDFPIYPYVKTNDPQGVANFDPRDIISTFLVEDF